MIDLLKDLYFRILHVVGVWCIRATPGTAFGIHMEGDAQPRFRIFHNGIMQWGDGDNPPDRAMGPIIVVDGNGIPVRCLFEFNGPRELPVGLYLVDMAHSGNDAISITAEGGDLVVRNEYNTAKTPGLVFNDKRII